MSDDQGSKVACTFGAFSVFCGPDGEMRVLGPGLPSIGRDCSTMNPLTLAHALDEAYEAGKKRRSYEINQLLRDAGGEEPSFLKP